ncbi:MAG: iron donor protein CyaY [Nitrospira sp.]|nr:iron donor protein CyaY [Candidatus Manganitrophaceae bacterium]HIL34818.1 iron donor protein CyaY [Candidatus Manganitrophaceae bacterium]
MNEAEFNTVVDDTLNKIERELDRLDVDLDYETSDGLLNLEFENGTKIILSRQTPLSQLWLATPTGAYHFDYDVSQQVWLDEKDKVTLFRVLSQHCTEHSGGEINLVERQSS